MPIHDVSYHKNPWDVGRGCQVATSFEAPGVSLGGFGVSIGMVRIVKVVKNLPQVSWPLNTTYFEDLYTPASYRFIHPCYLEGPLILE